MTVGVGVGVRVAGLLALVVAGLSAQPVRQERRTVAWHAELLHELWLRGREADPQLQAELDQALLADQAGNPLLPLARVRATLAGVDCDADFVTRCAVHVNALPEVVDPDVREGGSADVPYRLHVTLHTPYRLVEQRKLTFALALNDAAGKEVWRGEIGPEAADDLAMFTATAAIPMQGFADGAYTVTARARIGDAEPRPHDPVGRAKVILQRGFVRRALALGERATKALTGSDDAGVRAAIYGAIAPVHRLYTGEADDGTPDIGADLRHAVRVLDNVEAGRAPLAGATGFFDVAVELAPAPARDRLPVQVHARVRLAADASEPAPLVVFVVGSPTWDGALSRPSAVRTMPAGFLAHGLLAAGFDPERTRVCAVVQSVAEIDDPVAAVAKVVSTLTTLAGVDPTRVLLVGEREAADTVLACARAGVLVAAPRGVVLVAGGALAKDQVGMLADTPALLVPGRGHASAENLRRLQAFADAAGLGERVRLLEPARAWPWALRLALADIAAFAKQVGL